MSYRTLSRGTGSWFDDAFSALSNTAGDASYTVGSVAQNLINAGLSVAAISNILNGVATSAQATPAAIQAAQMEQQFLLQQQMQQNQPNKYLWPALAVIALLLLTRRND